MVSESVQGYACDCESWWRCVRWGGFICDLEKIIRSQGLLEYQCSYTEGATLYKERGNNNEIKTTESIWGCVRCTWGCHAWRCVRCSKVQLCVFALKLEPNIVHIWTQDWKCDQEVHVPEFRSVGVCRGGCVSCLKLCEVLYFTV